MAVYDIRSTVSNTTADVDGVIFEDVTNVGSGTGNYDTFLSIGGNDEQIFGYNTDDAGSLHPDNPYIGASQTETLLLANITSVIRDDGLEYYQIRFDLNEPNSDPISEQISIEEFRIFIGDTSSVITRTELEALEKIYDLDDTNLDGVIDDNTVWMSEVSTGSGTDDYAIFIPVSLFNGANPIDTYVYFDVTLGQTAPSDFEQDGGFEEFNIIEAGYIFGTKFEDLNGDGIQNGAEIPLEGVRIYIDANNDGMWNEGEKFDFSDEHGNWYLTGVEADGTPLIVREEIPDDWLPGWEATNPDGVDGNGAYWDAEINSTGDFVQINIGNFRPDPQFIVAKTAVGVDTADDGVLNAVGDIINYEIVVTNTGNVPLTNVSVTDPLLGGLVTTFTGDDGGDGILGLGEAWTYTGSYAITQEDLDSNATVEPANILAGYLENEACVVASYDGQPLDELCDDESVEIIQIPGINLVKLADVQFITGPGDITYTYTLTNTGNFAQDIVSLIDDNYTPLDLTDDIVVYDGTGAVTGDTDGDGLLDVGEMWTFDATVTVSEEQFENNDFLTNEACATTDLDAEACDDETVEVRRYEIEIDKVATNVIGSDTLVIDEADDIAVYEISVSNTGNQTLTNLEVTDSLDPSVVFTGGDDGDGLFEAGETWTYEATYTATQDDIDNNGIDYLGDPDGDSDIDNRATADADNVDPVMDDAYVPILRIPGIALEKTSDVTFIEGPGDITYTYKLTNTGNFAQDIVSLIDDNYTPGNTSDDILLYSGAGEVAGDDDLDGLLDVGEIWTFTATVTVTPDQFENNDLLTNEACAKTDLDIEACDDETVEVHRYDIGILKEVVDVIGSDTLVIDEVGDTAVYEITVTNEGNRALENVVVTDSLDPTVQFTGGDTNGDNRLDTDEVWTYEATYTATQDDIDNNGIDYLGDPDGDGDIDNRATANADKVDPVMDDAHVPIGLEEGIQLIKNSGTQTISGPALVTYTFELTNTGNFAQEISQLVDQGFTASTDDDVVLYENGDPTGPAMGDLDSDGLLDVDETWTFSYDMQITQEMFDSNLGGLVNVACVETGHGLEECGEYNIDRLNIAIEKSVVSVDGSTSYLVIDKAGEQVLYNIAVSNMGDVALTGLVVTDSIADAGSVLSIDADLDGFNDGDVNTDGNLDPNEIWHYSATYTALQSDIDTDGGGDGFVENVATADTDQIGPVEDNARVAVDREPELRLVKTVTDVAGRGPHATASTAGEIITYQLVATNTGNTTLTNVTIVDPLTGLSAGPVDLGPGEEFTVSNVQYEVTQEDLDTQGSSADGGPADCDIDNTAVANSNETDPVEATAEVMLDYNPSIDLEKLVSVNGGAFEDADLPTGPEVTVNGSDVTFRIELTNTGNITLTDIALTDVNLSDGVPVNIDLSGLTINGLVDADGDGMVDDLAVGGEAWLEYTLPANADQHINTATVTVAETTKNGDEVTDSDSAHYFGLTGDGPGVRTPGGWGQSWKLLTYWDGIEGNEPHSADDDNFPDAELTYDILGKGDGLLIGDYNQNGITDAGETTIFVALDDALDLVQSSTGTSKQNKTDDVGRQTVATWLNYLAGNEIGDDSGSGSVETARDWLNASVDWLLEYADDNEDGMFDLDGRIVRGRDAAWRSSDEGLEAGRDILSALDEYNNTGVIDGVRYAHDADSAAFVTALEIAADEFLF